MAMNMDALLRIKADVQGENNIRRLGNSMQGLQGQAKNAALAFNGLKGAVGGFAAAIAGSAIVGGLTAVVKKSIDAGDELFNLQSKTGIAANALIGLGNAAKLADVDQATLGKGLIKLSVNLVKAAEGNDGLAQKFKALGVSIKDSNGQVVPADKALKQIADRFADMPDGAQKAAAAVALFGKSGADLIPMLNEGAASMEKFTYKVGEDFAARSDLFNETITEFRIKTQGFGLELTDALLPALQSILEVFGDLFDTKQDWSALFDVIIVGLRAVATVIYSTIKLVDVAIKNLVAYFDAVGKVLQGDFGGAADVVKNRIGGLLEQARQDFAQIQKIWTGAPSPGTGRRTGGRSMERDTSSSDASAAAEAKRRAAEAKRAASEQERLLDRRQTLEKQAYDMQEKLRRSIEDTNAAYAGVGVSAADALFIERGNQLTDATRTTNDFRDDLVDLSNGLAKVGVSFDMKPTIDLINQLGASLANVTDSQYQQGLKDLLPSLADYDAKIAEVVRGKTELTELEKLNAQVNLLQLDILAATNPALAEQIRLLRERAGALDDATKKQEENSKSFGTKFKESFKQAYDAATDLGSNLASIATNGIDGLTDAIVEFATTGKASFKEFAVSILKDLSAMLIKFSIFKAIGALFPGLTGFANGGVFGGVSGPSMQPRTGFAKGGTFTNSIVSSPTLFKFANGGTMRTGLMGETGPEAIMPLSRGPNGKLGVASVGGSSTTNVVVNVDASGNSQVAGDQNQGAQLGRVISQAVQAELVKQKRPGGLLAA